MSEIHEDYRKLMSAVLRQAMDDYIKMQHPKQRQRKYEREAFWSARDLLWDNECELEIEDDEGNPMTLETLAMAAADRENVDLERLRSYVVQEAVNYWEDKDVKTIDIPEDVVIEGHTYQIQQSDERDIDFDSKIIYLDKRGPTAEEDFMMAMVELGCHHGNIRTSSKARKELGKVLYRLLRINSCFVGDQ
jgi:hypothetical protein